MYLNQRFAAYQQEFYQKTFEQTEVEFYLPETLSTRIEVPIPDTLVKVKPLLQEFAQPIKRITTTLMKQEKTLESSKDTTVTLLQVSEQKATEEIHQEEKPGKAFSKGRYIGLIIGIIALCVLLTVLRFKK